MTFRTRRLVAPLAAAILVTGIAATNGYAEPAGGGKCTVNTPGTNMRELPNTDPPGVNGQEVHRRLYPGDTVRGLELVDGWMRSERGYPDGEPEGVDVRGWIKAEFLDCVPFGPPGEPTRLQ